MESPDSIDTRTDNGLNDKNTGHHHRFNDPRLDFKPDFLRDFKPDFRIERILQFVGDLVSGNYSSREILSEKKDKIDSIIGGLNLVADVLCSSEKSRLLLDNILNIINDGVIVTGLDLRIYRINNSISRMLGYSGGDLSNQKITDIFYGDPAEAEIQELLAKQNTDFTMDIVCRSLNGTPVPASLAFFSMNSSGTDIREIIFIIHDNQEIRKLERDIEIGNYAYHELFENIHNSVAIYEPYKGGEDFIFQDLNLAAEKLENVKRRDIIGRRVTEVFPGVRDFGLLEVFQRVLKTGESEAYPLHFYKDGRISGWRENYVYKCPTGSIIAIYDDLTEEKQSEEALKLAAVAFETHDAILITDANARIIRVNKAFQDITGYSPDEVIGKNPSMMSSGRHDKSFYEEMWSLS